jgi:hypothetical protein
MNHLHLEVWSSSENRHERHYFMRDGQMHGYQRGQYVWGYNPALISDETAAKIRLLILREVKELG